MRREIIRRTVIGPSDSNKVRGAQMFEVDENAWGGKWKRTFWKLQDIKDEIKRLRKLYKAIAYLKRVHKKIP